jgi:hypothetical protein
VLQGCLGYSWEAQKQRQSCVAHSQLVVEELLTALPLPMRQVVAHRLEGYTVVEIARSLMISHRTVERLLQSVRQRLTVVFDQVAEAPPTGRIRLRKGTEKLPARDTSCELPELRMRIA